MFGNEAETREILGNVPGWLVAVFYAAAFAACAAAAAGFYLRHRTRSKGRPETSSRVSVGERFRAAVVYLTFHRQLRRDRFAGTAHLLMFYGFTVLFVGTCLVGLEHDTPLHFLYGWFYKLMSLACDLGGLMLLAGTGMFLWRRVSGGSGRILRGWWVTSLAALLAVIGISGFATEAARIAASSFPPFERWSAVGYALAVPLHVAGVGPEGAAALHRVLWAAHAVVCVAFFALLPWGFFSHMAYGLASWAGRARKPLAALPVVPVGPGAPPGAASWDQLTRPELLQADACTTCGRCNAVCPANAAGKPLRPREVVLGVRAAVTSNAPLGSHIPDDALWSCTTCGACTQACPVGIGVYEMVVDLRRGRVEAGEVPPRAESVFESTADRFNPFGRSNDERMSWAAGLPVPVAGPAEPIEVLYWVGCAGSFDPDGRGVAQAVVKILNHLGVNYRVLGRAERRTGDPARRMGEEGLFRELAEQNAAAFERHGVRHVLTHCPHCFNTFTNEYPQLRSALGGWRVQHHSQFLAEMLAAGKLAPGAGGAVAGTVTFHDPCYLGRGNGEVTAPRRSLLSLPQVSLAEMPRSGRESFCCGAGGGAMWLDVRGTDRVENLRYEEARGTRATSVVTGCPFCKSVLRTAGDGRAGPAVRDLAELVAESLAL